MRDATINNRMKIVHKNYIYEAIKVNQSIVEYANNLIATIRSMDLSHVEYGKTIFTGTIQYKKNTQMKPKNSVGYEFEVFAYFDENIFLPTMYQIFRDDRDESNIIKDRKFKIPFVPGIAKDKLGFPMWLDLLRESAYHELLHAIDPKVEDDILYYKHKWSLFRKYVDSSKNLAQYRNQILEKGVTLSALAKQIVDSHSIDFLKTNIKIPKFIEDMLPEYMDSLNNRKEFSKLLSHYLNEKINNV